MACARTFRFTDNCAAVAIVESVTDLIAAWLTTADETFAGSWIIGEKLMHYFARPCQPMNKYEFNLRCNTTSAHSEN